MFPWVHFMVSSCLSYGYHFFFVIIKNIKFIDNDVNKFMVKYIKEKCHPKNNPFLLLVRLTKVIH